MRVLFAGLAVVGAVTPFSAVIPWLADNGMAPRSFVAAMFANPIATFFSLDVLISAIVVVLFCIAEARAGRLAYPVPPILATCLIGVSCGLPLLLALRRANNGRTGHA